MTSSQRANIVHGRAPATDALIDEVLAEARAAILAAPHVPAALSRLHYFVTLEYQGIAAQRGIDPKTLHAGDPRAALKTAIGL